MKYLKHTLLAALFAAAAITSASAQSEPLKLENAACVLTFDPAKESFSIRQKSSGKEFVKNGAFEERGGKASLAKVTNKYLGEVHGIEIVYPNGNRNTMALYEGLPFVVFDAMRHNGTAEPQILNRVPLFTAEVDTGAAPDKVKTLGTGGLRAPEENPGSYAFLAFADPATRQGVVGGWLTQDRGSGVVFSPVTNGVAQMQTRVDFGRLRIKAGENQALETFLIGWFDDARDGLENYADQIAKIYKVKLPPKTEGLCTWYMQKHGGASNEFRLPEVTTIAAKELKPFGFDFILIDDGWQAGIGGNGDPKNFTEPNPRGVSQRDEGGGGKHRQI
jgi:hypothetical protein